MALLARLALLFSVAWVIVLVVRVLVFIVTQDPIHISP